MWGATWLWWLRKRGQPNFNPRSPCGERPTLKYAWYEYTPISIHAPRVGSDVSAWLLFEDTDKFQSTLPVWGATIYAGNETSYSEFQSTLPVWGATFHVCPSFLPERISIHAPRVGSDRPNARWGAGDSDFNPRSPCGERPFAAKTYARRLLFQSTLPVWGATISIDFRRWCK